MDLVLGIDLGTSYFKLGLFDRAGIMQGLGSVFVGKDIEDGSRCALPVERFQKFLHQGLSQACTQVQANPRDIQAIAYSSQAGSFVLLDQNNEPLTPMVIWLDRRAEKIDPHVQELWDRKDFLQKTGLGWKSPEACIAKLGWFKHNKPDIWSQVNRIMTISDYLTFILTSQTVGDMGTASLLGLLDLQNHRWWDEAFETLELSKQQFSTPLEPGAIAGKISNNGSQLFGLQTGIPFAVGSLDHHIAAIGAGVGQIADLSESIGTVLACLNYAAQYRPQADCCMGPGLDVNHYYQLAFSNNGASSLDWYQKNYAPDQSITELVKLAETVAMGSDNLMAKPFPSQYSDLTGFQNVKISHTHGHFVRAIMESTAATVKKLVDDLCGAKKPKKIVATGGGAKSDLWLQIQADLLGAEFVSTNCVEPACRGAAIFAAVAAGWFTSVEKAAAAWISANKSFKPIPDRHREYQKWYDHYTQVIACA